MKRSKGPRALAEAVANVTDAACARRGLAGAAIVTDWPAIVGERLARDSAPLGIRFGPDRRSGGTLLLRVHNGSLALELQHLAPIVIERINAHFGYRAVEKLQLRQVPAPQPKPDSVVDLVPDAPNAAPSQPLPAAWSTVLARIADPDLRDALTDLADAIARDRP